MWNQHLDWIVGGQIEGLPEASDVREVNIAGPGDGNGHACSIHAGLVKRRQIVDGRQIGGHKEIISEAVGDLRLYTVQYVGELGYLSGPRSTSWFEVVHSADYVDEVGHLSGMDGATAAA